MSKRVVRKVLQTSDGIVYPGTVIDVSGWTNLPLLEDMGYVSPVDEPEEDETPRPAHSASRRPSKAS